MIKLIALCEGNFSDDLAVFTDRVKQLAKSREEGRLIMQSNGRYSLNGHELTSGHRIEVFIEDESDYGSWQFGRIEYAENFGGYYFFNEGGTEHHKLRMGRWLH